MKISHAGLAVLSGLAAVVTADALPPEQIPVQCATICGPIVELTSACNTKNARLLKLRRLDERERVLRLDDEPEVAVHAGIRVDDRVQKRQFSVIVQAPTSFPPDVVPPTTVQKPTTRHVESSKSLPETTAPPAATTSPDLAQVSAPSATSSTTSVQGSSGAGDLAQQKGWAAPEGAEEQCVCLNDSFDVASVTALCASCITQAGERRNNLDIIESTCNFTTLVYSPANDSIVNNVQVKATPASAAWGENAGVEGGAPRTGECLGVAMGAVGIALGVLVML